MRHTQKKLDQLRQEYEKASETADYYEGIAEECRRKWEKACAENIAKEKGIDADNVVVWDGWECEESPTGFCVYDHSGPYYDECCIYCGQPEERK